MVLKTIRELSQGRFQSGQLHLIFVGCDNIYLGAWRADLPVYPDNKFTEPYQVVHLVGVHEVGILDPYLVAAGNVSCKDRLKILAKLAFFNVDNTSFLQTT